MISLFAGCVQQSELRLATSTCDTGLLDVLNKKFENGNNVKILTICEGTGKAIATGEPADVVMVHAPDLELKTLANGSLINRSYMMHNYFVIIGPGQAFRLSCP
ncbi:MAG: hypothetical protein OIN88_14275 [Candidatus Methanoperedens sp.]|nr:hypothetical protein [Candidatus Methanoperedens sp.]MCZ7361039.1 hypothetical protein [Candidatus Methanoperedens sp.]HLB71197.1 substrate-binding domain-containing protein [Candidatus Methanoperedens sp.]